MANLVEVLVGILNFIYAPMDFIVPIVFWYCSSFLRTLTVGIIGVLTLAKILSIPESKICKTLRVLLIVYYFGYTLYSLGIFTNLTTLDILDWGTFLMTICAPISLLILGRIISNFKVLEYKVFSYITVMLIYLLIGYLWYLFAPDTLNFIVFFVVWVLALFFVVIVIIITFAGGKKPIEQK
ncbi:MAG: hypothetical protein ACFE8A_13490 [Candidatus Hodarchaeota archaeon]